MMKPMRASWISLLFASCTVVNYGSNLPDGGRCPPVDGGGSATLDGSLAFPVASATESQEAIIHWQQVDGGLIAPPADAGGSPFIVLSWLSATVPAPDGGCCASGTGLYAFLGPAADAGTWSGSYFVGDGGSALVELAETFPQGNGTSILATSGHIDVTTTFDCLLAGDIDVRLGDAGALSGTFQAVYEP